MNPSKLSNVLEKQDYELVAGAVSQTWYIVQTTWNGPVNFAQASAALGTLGAADPTGRSIAGLFLADGWVYSRSRVNDQDAICRVKFEDHKIRSAPYDTLAPNYSTLYEAAEYQAEDKQTIMLLNQLVSGDRPVIDIGCGSGLFLDLLPEHTNYLGLDISTEMLKIARANHPSQRFICCAAEDWWVDVPDETLIVSLYGSPSYVDVSIWARWPNHEKFLMFYKPGYTALSAKHVIKYPTTNLAYRPGQDLFDKYELVTGRG